MSIYYTYLIGWSAHNKWYYGVRYAKGCTPDDLWTTYFTSSVYIKECRCNWGEPDVIEVRRTFDCVDDARMWESRVLKRMKVVIDDKWINKTDNISIDPVLAGHAKGRTYVEMYGEEKAAALKRNRSLSNARRAGATYVRGYLHGNAKKFTHIRQCRVCAKWFEQKNPEHLYCCKSCSNRGRIKLSN